MSGLFGLGKRIIKGKKQQNSLTKLYLLYAEASLVTGNLRNIVSCPVHLRGFEDEWIASNVFDFFNCCNSLYSTLSVEFCTPKNCPCMNAGDGTEYSWVDSQKKSIKVSAPQYIDYMMTSIQNQLDDDSLFPTRSGMEYPKDFQVQIARPIFKQFVRLFAHIYHQHFDTCLHLEEEAHLNTLFAHIVTFGREFDLIDRRDLMPLQDLVDLLKP